MRQPGLVALHAVTSTNALHFAYQTCESDETRKMLLLQNAAFLPLFRGDPAGGKAVKIDLFEPLPLKATGRICHRRDSGRRQQRSDDSGAQDADVSPRKPAPGKADWRCPATGVR